MLADRLSEDGAAQALGWPKARVTACVKLLELPERAQGSSGSGFAREFGWVLDAALRENDINVFVLT